MKLLDKLIADHSFSVKVQKDEPAGFNTMSVDEGESAFLGELTPVENPYKIVAFTLAGVLLGTALGFRAARSMKPVVIVGR